MLVQIIWSNLFKFRSPEVDISPPNTKFFRFENNGFIYLQNVECKK